MREAIAEPAGLEKVAERLAVRIRRIEQRRRFPIEAHDLPEQEEVATPSSPNSRTRFG